MKYKLNEIITEYTEKNTDNLYQPVAVGKYGIRQRSDIYKKELAKDYSKNKVIKQDTMIIGMGSTQIDFGVLSDNKVYSVSPAYHTFKINTSIVKSDFFALLLKAKNEILTRKYMIASARQGKSVNLKEMVLEEVIIPDFDTQQQIIERVSSINNLISIEKNRIALFDELVKSRFIEMFEGKYPTIKIGEKFTTTSGGTPLKSHKEFYDNGDIPWLTSGEVNSGIITSVKNRITKLGLEKSSAKLVPQNSVVVAMYGATAGKVGLLTIPSTTNQAVCSVLPNDDYLPMFVYRAMEFKSEEMADRASGGAQSNISQGIVRDTEIYNAPLCVQKEFVSFAEQIDKSKFIIQNRIKLLEELLNTKMYDYFVE